MPKLRKTLTEIEPIATTQLRWILRKNGLSGNPACLTILQQWWSDGIDGQWQDVPVEKDVPEPLPDGATNRGRLRG